MAGIFPIIGRDPRVGIDPILPRIPKASPIVGISPITPRADLLYSALAQNPVASWHPPPDEAYTPFPLRKRMIGLHPIFSAFQAVPPPGPRIPTPGLTPPPGNPGSIHSRTDLQNLLDAIAKNAGIIDNILNPTYFPGLHNRPGSRIPAPWET